ncbi:hypothetical protein TcCL_NonESM00315 [Trypanosoma cruzi]|nr:hypothetical protein TcCL_NonESM00315 [Trypanosoma cruzi]
MLYLEDCYNNFLEEGLRKLQGERGGSNSRGLGSLFQTKLLQTLLSPGLCVQPFAPQKKSSNTNSHGEEYVNPLAMASRERSVVSTTPSVGRKLWTWVVDRIIVGVYRMPTRNKMERGTCWKYGDSA